ncbi:hypothetical protein MKEN_00629300 [Mycena kentingensis (nom. inval.)]|nr:hypothetical protein MKEN_00629300 [Mycena kentingensis (nom. inval.)]
MLQTMKAFVLLGAGLSFVGAQTMEKCNTQGTLCFQQITDPTTQITLGLALPPGGAIDVDFLAQLTVPVPYGFAGFGVGANSAIPQASVGGFVTRFTLSGPSGAVVNAMLVQQNTLSADGSKLFPTSAGGGTVQVSSLSSYTSTAANFIFRCQNCLTSSDSGPLGLTLFSSSRAPIYPAIDALNATLLTAGATISTVEFSDTVGLQTAEYAGYLAVAGVE